MDPGPDIDAVLAILSRADDPDLADIVELVAKICEAEAVGITILRDDDYHVPITYGIMPFVSPSTNTLLPAHDEHRGRLRHRGRALDQSMEYGAAGEEPDLVEVDLGRVAQQLRGTEIWFEIPDDEVDDAPLVSTARTRSQASCPSADRATRSCSPPLSAACAT